MKRAAADHALVVLVNSVLPEYELLMGRLRKDGFVSKVDEATLQEVKRLLEDAAGRLLVRAKAE